MSPKRGEGNMEGEDMLGGVGGVDKKKRLGIEMRVRER